MSGIGPTVAVAQESIHSRGVRIGSTSDRRDGQREIEAPRLEDALRADEPNLFPLVFEPLSEERAFKGVTMEIGLLVEPCEGRLPDRSAIHKSDHPFRRR